MKQEASMFIRAIRATVSFLAVPWDAFVAAFLYYAVLTLVVLGGADPSLPLLGAAYLAVPAAYALVLAARVSRAVLHVTIPAVGDTNLVLH
jgi:hypothetical protein